MKPVVQTKFGGVSGPREEFGNCLQACLASLFEVELDEAVDINAKEMERIDWVTAINEWVAPRGLQFVYVGRRNAEDFEPWTDIKGYYIARVNSLHHRDGTYHAVVMNDGEVAHDPHPDAGEWGTGNKVYGVYLFVTLDAAGARISGASRSND